MKLTTISTLSVVVALASASHADDGLAENASVMDTAGAENATGAESTGANATAYTNATALDLLSDDSFAHPLLPDTGPSSEPGLCSVASYGNFSSFLYPKQSLLCYFVI